MQWRTNSKWLWVSRVVSPVAPWGQAAVSMTWGRDPASSPRCSVILVVDVPVCPANSVREKNRVGAWGHWRLPHSLLSADDDSTRGCTVPAACFLTRQARGPWIAFRNQSVARCFRKHCCSFCCNKFLQELGRFSVPEVKSSHTKYMVLSESLSVWNSSFVFWPEGERSSVSKTVFSFHLCFQTSWFLSYLILAQYLVKE